MAHKTKIGKNASPTKGNLGHIWLTSITRQPIELELLKSCKDSSLAVWSKKFFVWGFWSMTS